MKQPRCLLAACAAVIAVSACTSEAPAPAPGQNQSVETGRPDQATSASAAKAPAQSSNSEPVAPTPIAATARRCGWLHNPTPANWWLVDRDGQWVLSTQGREGVPGMDEMPDMSTSEWVETNGHYGYGCACMDMVVHPASGDVVRISKAEAKPLAQCRSDRKLPGPDE